MARLTVETAHTRIIDKELAIQKYADIRNIFSLGLTFEW